MRRATTIALLFCVVTAGAAHLHAQAPRSGRNTINIRGHAQDVYYYPADRTPALGKVIFAPGDGGWRGLAVDIAKQVSANGYEVYGLDTRVYLHSFTGGPVLKTSEIAGDMADLAQWARQGRNDPVVLMGWSEGAGLAIAAGAEPGHRSAFAGVVAIGMTEHNILAWRWTDLPALAIKKLPNEPTFPSRDYVGRVAPLPLAMISSARDEYVSLEATRQLFAAAMEPKRLIVLDAQDHKFAGKEAELFRALQDALTWIGQQRK